MPLSNRSLIGKLRTAEDYGYTQRGPFPPLLLQVRRQQKYGIDNKFKNAGPPSRAYVSTEKPPSAAKKLAVPYLTTPRMIMPEDPIRTPADKMAEGSAKLPEPMLALAKLKKVATTLKEQHAERRYKSYYTYTKQCAI